MYGVHNWGIVCQPIVGDPYVSKIGMRTALCRTTITDFGTTLGQPFSFRLPVIWAGGRVQEGTKVKASGYIQIFQLSAHVFLLSRVLFQKGQFES